jgi:aryl-alcohol dehydrogenase
VFQADAAVVHQQNTPFRIEPVTLDDPQPHEIAVRMVATGLCHTDISAQDGKFPFSIPGVLGHEGAGIVEAVGAAVTTVEPGDKVLLSFTSCGQCPSCRTARPALCDSWLPLNLFGRPATIRTTDGTGITGHFFGQSSFATMALADDRNAVRVSEDARLEILAPLGCGIQTGAGTVLDVLKPTPGSSIAVVGSGAVGLSAVMASALTPATTIIAVDRMPERLSLASEFGATDVIDVNQAPLAEALRDATAGRGVDFAIDTTGHVETISTTISCLAVGGKIALVGAPPFGSTIPIDVNWMLPGRSIVGVTEGSSDPHRLLPTLIRLYEQGRLPIDRLVKTYPFADIQVAADDLRSGRTIKPVIVF